MSTFSTLRDRDAWNTIRGYVYQVDLTIERWLNLQPGQTLELECGEDIDIVSRSLTATPEERQRLLEQVKHRDSSITLKTSEAVTAIACFIEHRQANPTANLLFRFTTNTEVGQEKLSPMPNKTPAIAAWEQIRRGNLQATAKNAAIQGIRTILKKVKQPKKLHDDTWKIFGNFITKASDDQFLDLISSFEWSTKAPPAKSLSSSLQELLVERKHARDNIETQEQYRRLFLYVFKRLCEPGIKQLTLDELSSQLSVPTLSETDHQLLNNLLVWFHALEVRVQEHEVRLGVLEQHLDRERTETYIGQEVADCVDNLLRDYTKLFVGRETTLKQLDEFLSQKRTNLLTLIAPAGFGKTALLANWVASRQGNGCFIAYHFFSQRYDVTRSFSAAYRNLLRQLYDYYEPSDRQIPNNEDGLRDKLYRLIKEYSERDGRPRVIVLDALDEAEPPFREFLPLLPENVFLIASARAEQGQEPEYLRGWTDNALPIRLNRLCRGAIAHWIRQAGNGELAGFAEDTHFVAQLDEITQGFPLYLRYLTEELIQAQQGGEDVQVVLTGSPKKFGDYVQKQFEQLARVEEIRRQEVRELFPLLSVAFGPLSQDDIQDLTNLDEWDLPALPWQATRWFSIQEGFYSFAHPLLAKEFQRVLRRQASSAKEKLIEYCSWQKYQSRYALRHYAEHLRQEKQWEELYVIARDKDFAVAQREQLPDEPDLSLKTVQAALLGAAETDNAGAMAEFMLVHARQLMQTTVQESPLDALRSGSLERALRLADDFYEIERCVLWYLLLAWELKDTGRLEEAQATLKQLQHKELPRFSEVLSNVFWQGNYAAYLLTYTLEVSEDSFLALQHQLLNDRDRSTLCKNLAKQCHFLAAHQTAQQISKEPLRAEVLQEIAAIAKAEDISPTLNTTQQINYELPGAEARGEVAVVIARGGESSAFDTAMAQQFNDEFQRAWALRDIATVMAKAGEFACALDQAKQINLVMDKAEAFACALGHTKQINYNRPEVEALKDIAVEMAKAKEFTYACQTAGQIKAKSLQAETLGEIAAEMTKAGDIAAQSTFDSARQMAQQIDNKLLQVCVLGKIAAEMTKAGDIAAQATFDSARQMAQHDKSLQIYALEEIAAAILKAGDTIAAQSTFVTVLQTAQQIDDEWSKSLVLRKMTAAMVKLPKLILAFKAVRQIKYDWPRSEALGEIAAAIAKRRRFSIALKTAKQIKDHCPRAEALGKIAAEMAKAGDATAQFTFDSALQTAQQIEDEYLKSTALGAIAAAEANAGFGQQAVRTSQTILIDRKEQFLKIAEAFGETGDKTNFKQLMIPCSYSLYDAYRMCGLLARLYPEKAKEIAKVVSELN